MFLDGTKSAYEDKPPILQARVVPTLKEEEWKKIVGEEKVKQVKTTTPKKSWLPLLKEIKETTLFIFIVAMILQVGIPSRKTLITMRATKFITTSNIAKAIEVGGHFKDIVKRDVIDIIEAVEAGTKKKKKRKK